MTGLSMSRFGAKMDKIKESFPIFMGTFGNWQRDVFSGGSGPIMWKKFANIRCLTSAKPNSEKILKKHQ